MPDYSSPSILHCSSSITRVANPASLRTASCGQLIGLSVSDSVHLWQGIPYAQPPLGPLRWRAPQPMKPWQGIYFALQPGPACTQRDVYAASSNTVKVIGSEDCLYLNIWAPAFQPESIPQQDRQLPVMVWIHGGSNIRGEGSTFRAETFVLSQKSSS